jgi:zinc transport system ATP-binding protein
MSGELLVACEEVSLVFADRAVLQNVSLRVNADEVVTLVGPNGAGKSSLIKILLGLLPITQGRLQRASDLRIGYVPQRFQLSPVLPLSVARLMTLTQRASRAAMQERLAEVGVAKLIDTPVQQLSGGELQRVLLARALLREPNLLVLDEPTQGVDFTGAAQLYGLIADIRQRHRCGVLMVSHDLHVVMSATDRVVCLNQHVCCAGEPQSVAVHPEYQALFGQSFAQNLAVYTHHHDHRHTVAGEVVSSGHTHGEACQHD